MAREVKGTMNFEGLIGLFEVLARIKLKRYALVLMVILTTIRYLKVRRERKKITQKEEDALIETMYQKNEDGLYPWEVDIDDHPSRVGKKSKPIPKNWGAQRGKW